MVDSRISRPPTVERLLANEGPGSESSVRGVAD
jgi:hypothetical protein